ncbi:hypothetical protein F8388_024147 [Cannabis sativa]|uniref:Serine/threonine-protein phosphatase 4 regulatory subunit 3-like central domain-containing protein n=1 Tax=Cannabis sativa TaxID=3483 RepID=A0A7J6FXS1_CANSA|nr:hypothetical protein F8388_024147 [Cannabis sativa]KAF4383392.1 hypothetical protein G4B88_023966 [Cannabis sativa]
MGSRLDEHDEQSISRGSSIRWRTIDPTGPIRSRSARFVVDWTRRAGRTTTNSFGYTYQRSIGPLENTPDISSWDVILASVLDETTIGNLNSIIHSNNVVVVSLLKDDSTFIQELFARIRSPSTSEESEKILNYNPINPRNDPKYNLPLTKYLLVIASIIYCGSGTSEGKQISPVVFYENNILYILENLALSLDDNEDLIYCLKKRQVYNVRYLLFVIIWIHNSKVKRREEDNNNNPKEAKAEPNTIFQSCYIIVCTRSVCRPPAFTEYD